VSEPIVLEFPGSVVEFGDHRGSPRLMIKVQHRDDLAKVGRAGMLYQNVVVRLTLDQPAVCTCGPTERDPLCGIHGEKGGGR